MFIYVHIISCLGPRKWYNTGMKNIKAHQEVDIYCGIMMCHVEDVVLSGYCQHEDPFVVKTAILK